MTRSILVSTLMVCFVLVSGGPALAYDCPRRRPPNARSYRSKDKKLTLHVSRTGVGKLSRRAGGVVWSGVKIGFVPDVVTFHKQGPWVAVFAHSYGVKVIGPRGGIKADYPYHKLLKRWDLRKAGYKCGSWWLVSARPSFRRRGKRVLLFVRFDWGRIVQISLPSGKLARWLRRKP